MAHSNLAAPTMPQLFDTINVAHMSAATPDPVEFRTTASLVAILAAGSPVPSIAELIDVFETGARYMFATCDGGPNSPAADELHQRLETAVMDGICSTDGQDTLAAHMMLLIKCDQIADGADHDPLVGAIVRSAAHLLTNPVPSAV